MDLRSFDSVRQQRHPCHHFINCGGWGERHYMTSERIMNHNHDTHVIKHMAQSYTVFKSNCIVHLFNARFFEVFPFYMHPKSSNSRL